MILNDIMIKEESENAGSYSCRKNNSRSSVGSRGHRRRKGRRSRSSPVAIKVHSGYGAIRLPGTCELEQEEEARTRR